MRRLRRALTFVVALAVLATGAVVASPTTPSATAAVASAFDPGFIISDPVFYDSGALTTDQIQSFLSSKGAACVAGEQPCLKGYTTPTRSWPSEAGLCAGYTGRGSETAAQVIRNVALSCGINPMVLIVMLEKENSLITRTRPTTRSYDAAMGFGCPDTAPCNTEYYGFFNQVYRAARQYKVYASTPLRYGYQAGRTNYVRYNPTASCGGTQVYIRNQATAALYIYTPYQPNAAALNNLYGSGDSCSAYGNRNFWRLFSDWFGNPQHGGFMIKGASSSTVYMVAGSTKHPVADYATYLAYSNLGPIVTVSDAQVNGYTTGATLSRFVRNPTTGVIYFVDANIKLHARSCEIVADYGSGCTSAVNLNDQQLNLLRTGPALTNAYVTSDWKHFYVSGGKRREVFDTQSLSAAGLPTASVQLTESGISRLPYGTPIVRDHVVVQNRRTKTLALYTGGTLSPVSTVMAGLPGLSGLPRAPLDEATIVQLKAGATLNGIVSPVGTSTKHLLTTSGLVSASATALGTPGPTAAAWDTTLVAAFRKVNGGTGALAVKSPTSPVVYVLEGGLTRRVHQWPDLVDHFGGTAPPVYVVADETLKAFRAGAAVPSAGTLVKIVGKPELYLVDGGRRLIYVDSFDTLTAMGTRTWSEVPASAVAGYPVAPLPLSPFLACGSGPRVALGGGTYAHARAEAGDALSTPLTTSACAALPYRGGQITGPVFVKSSSDPVVYRVIAGRKHPVTSWASLVTMAGTGNPQIYPLSPALLGSIPTSTPVG